MKWIKNRWIIFLSSYFLKDKQENKIAKEKKFYEKDNTVSA